MSELSIELAAALHALGVDKLTISAADLLAAKSRAISLSPGANGAIVIESRRREFTAPEQPTLFATG